MQRVCDPKGSAQNGQNFWKSGRQNFRKRRRQNFRNPHAPYGTRRDVIDRIPCVIKLLPTTKGAASFYDFGEYARLVDVARRDPHAYLIALLGGEAGLRCGEMMALERTDVDMNTRQLCVARSDWKGHVTVPKGGRLSRLCLRRYRTHRLRVLQAR